MLKENTKAPGFNLIDQDYKSQALFDFRGKWIVLYFYPRDDSPGCTREAKNFKENIKKFQEQNTEVIGISPDLPESHKKFSEKYKIPIILLSDPDKEVIKKYHAKGLVTKRISYLIDPEGTIARVYPSVNPARHAEDILNDLKLIKG